MSPSLGPSLENVNTKATTDLAIRLRGVVKRYGEITAIGGLDLDVPYGTCVGLLGPNGAGKTTTMKMLTAQAIADEGELEVLGFRLPDESKQARAQLGVTPQLDNLDVTLTVEQNLLVSPTRSTTSATSSARCSHRSFSSPARSSRWISSRSGRRFSASSTRFTSASSSSATRSSASKAGPTCCASGSSSPSAWPCGDSRSAR